MGEWMRGVGVQSYSAYNNQSGPSGSLTTTNNVWRGYQEVVNVNRFAIGGPIALGIILMALFAIRQSPYRVSATQSQAQTIPTPGLATNLSLSQIAREEPVVLFLRPDCTY